MGLRTQKIPCEGKQKWYQVSVVRTQHWGPFLEAWGQDTTASTWWPDLFPEVRLGSALGGDGLRPKHRVQRIHPFWNP